MFLGAAEAAVFRAGYRHTRVVSFNATSFKSGDLWFRRSLIRYFFALTAGTGAALWIVVCWLQTSGQCPSRFTNTRTL